MSIDNNEALVKARAKLRLLDAEKEQPKEDKKKVKTRVSNTYLMQAIDTAISCVDILPVEEARINALLAEIEADKYTDDNWELKMKYHADQLELMKKTYPLFSEEAKRRKDLIESVTRRNKWSAEIDKCANDTQYWFDNYAWTSDPRKSGIWSLPFMLYDYQKEAIDWLEKLMFTKKSSGVIEKSRDLGFSWLLISLFYKHWQHKEGFHALIGSITADECDTIGDHSSMFEKIREQSRLQPMQLLPKGWDGNISYMKAVNPVTKSTITGSTSNADFGRGGRYTCLIGDTLIQTPDGLMPIKKMAENGYPEIISPNGETEKVKGYIIRPKEPVFKVVTNGKFNVTGTSDHPLIKVRSNGELEKVAIKDLKIGDKLRLVNSSPKGSDTMSVDEAIILGYLLSEGYVARQDGTIQFCNADDEVLDHFKTLWDRLYDYKVKYKEGSAISSITGKTSTWKTCTINSVEIRKKLFDLGLTYSKSTTKEIPEKILLGTKEIKTAFLKSLFEGDGSLGTYDGKFRVSYSSLSDKLLKQLQILLLEFGIIATLATSRTRKEGKLSMNGYNGFVFCKEIGFISTRKKAKEPKILPTNWRIKPNDVIIKEIIECEPEITYDLECENHLFIANGLISHNCILFDEFASFEMDTAAMTASSQSSPCKIYNSTAKGMGNEYYRLAHNNKIEKKTFHWTAHPYKTNTWYEYQKLEMSDIQIAQELDINYDASQPNKVYPMYKEYVHVVTKSEVMRALPSFQDRNGNFQIPLGHSLYMGEDVGQTTEHVHMMLWFATLKEGTVTTDGIDLSGSVFAYREMQMSPKSPPRLWANAIKQAEGLYESQMINGRFISHEADTEVQVYADEYNLHFDKWHPDYNTGISRMRDYLDIVFEHSEHPFREHTRKIKYPDAPPIMGRPHIYMIVDDEQGELMYDKASDRYYLTPAIDNNGFMRSRYEFPMYHYPASEVGKEVKKMRPKKKDDDAMDVFKCIAGECFPPINKETDSSKLEKQLPNHLRLGNIESLPLKQMGMAFLQRQEEIRKLSKANENVGLSYRDTLMKSLLRR